MIKALVDLLQDRRRTLELRNISNSTEYLEFESLMNEWHARFFFFREAAARALLAAFAISHLSSFCFLAVSFSHPLSFFV